MKRTLLSILCLFAFIPTTFAGYSDVPISYEYNQGITFLELSGAIDSNKNFRPEEQITKAELFKILFEVLREDPNSVKTTNTFTDVNIESWYAPYAELAAQYNLVETTDTFNPTSTVNHLDGLEILMNSYGISAGVVPYSERIKLFMDVPAFHPEYTILHRAVELGLIESNTEIAYRPYSALTRGEFADLIMKLDEWQMVDLASENDGFYKSDILAQIWDTITSSFYLPDGEQIDEEALFQATVKGMLDSLNDPYTKYFSPDDADSFFTSLGSDYEGIGAFLIQDEETGQIFITEFVEDSPAKEAGLKIGDEITHVDGTTVTGMLLDNVIDRIKGAEDTEVQITILRDDEEHKTFDVKRKQLTITMESAEVIWGDVWYLDINAFGSGMSERVYNLILEMEEEEPEPEAIVIDLRGNGGGYLNMGNFVAGLFLPEYNVLVQLDYGDYIEPIYTGVDGALKDLQVYILVDEFTASASEIVAATLQEIDDAVVIGKQTFGKGTTQQVLTFWDGSMLKFTMAEWLTSQGNSINGIGVTPDIKITGESETKDLWLEQVKKEL